MKEFLQKHKKLVISLSVILGVFLLLLILGLTVFTLKTVEVDFKNETQFFNEERVDAIKESDTIKKNSSIFGVSKKEIKNNLEKTYPYIKVINIETVFPNKIIIHCAEREETYAVKVDDSLYFICDAEFKVLSVEKEYYSGQAILFTGLENLITNSNRANTGDFLEFSSEEEMLKNIGTSLLQANKTVAYQKSLIKSIELKSGKYYYTGLNQPYFVIKDQNDFQTNIYAVDTTLSEKFQCMFAFLGTVAYNPSMFFADEIKNGEKDLSETDETKTTYIKPNYYLDYVLKILETNEHKLQIRLEKIAENS